jgi:hypothetical protein
MRRHKPLPPPQELAYSGVRFEYFDVTFARRVSPNSAHSCPPSQATYLTVRARGFADLQIELPVAPPGYTDTPIEQRRLQEARDAAFAPLWDWLPLLHDACDAAFQAGRKEQAARIRHALLLPR